MGPHTHIGLTVWLTGLQSLVLAHTDVTSCQQCLFIPQKLLFFSPSLSTAAPESVVQHEMHQPCARHKSLTSVESSGTEKLSVKALEKYLYL